MSGGVDSSVAAALMRERGYDCIGVTMKLFYNEDIGLCRDDVCCSLDDTEDARAIAASMDMPFYVFNFTRGFKEYVTDRFVSDYEAGRTPNPCINCNRYLKFGQLYQRARELGCTYVATGHYARVTVDEKSGRYLLKKAADPTKDQSYVLYMLSQEQLAHTIFPLGDMTKNDARKFAAKRGFSTASKSDSQDICFVVNGSYVDFIEEYTGKSYPGGDFVDANGNVLGRHKGLIRYTVGQRKGLGIAFGKPMYVTDLCPQKNQVVLGEHEKLLTREVILRDINLISLPEIKGEMHFKAKIRYRHEEQPCTVTQDGNTLRLYFDEPQRAVTRGQAGVIYDGDTVVGGGIIC